MKSSYFCIAALLISSASAYQTSFTAPYSLRVGAPLVTAGHADPNGPQFADADAALGIPDLKNVMLPPGAREIRVTEDYPMVVDPGYTYAIPMLRLIDLGGGNVQGELLFVRRGTGSSRTDEQCASRANGYICVRIAQFKSPPNWQEVAAKVEALGMWSLLESCDEGGPLIADAGSLRMHRLIGDQFSSYYCSAPQYRFSGVGRTANAIHEYLRTLSRMTTDTPKNLELRPNR